MLKQIKWIEIIQQTFLLLLPAKEMFVELFLFIWFVTAFTRFTACSWLVAIKIDS